MEKFTNNRAEFMHQLKSDLLAYEVDDHTQPIFSYLEIPFFLPYAFSYQLSRHQLSSNLQLKSKEWKAGYDRARFDKGIYNLDRLAIVEKALAINPRDDHQFKALNWREIDTLAPEGIVLDGLICELHLIEPQKVLRWNTDEEMNASLQELVRTIRNWKRAF